MRQCRGGSQSRLLLFAQEQQTSTIAGNKRVLEAWPWIRKRKETQPHDSCVHFLFWLLALKRSFFGRPTSTVSVFPFFLFFMKCLLILRWRGKNETMDNATKFLFTRGLFLFQRRRNIGDCFRHQPSWLFCCAYRASVTISYSRFKWLKLKLRSILLFL